MSPCECGTDFLESLVWLKTSCSQTAAYRILRRGEPCHQEEREDAVVWVGPLGW